MRPDDMPRNASRDAEPTKPTNPKDSIGIRKSPLSTVPAPVIAEVGVAMLEGAARRQGRCLIFRDVSHISALSRGRITRRRASPAA